VTPGLAGLLGKCLAADPQQRYATAEALARDLRQHLANRPLQGVANRSLPERWRKWRRRQPYALPLMGLVLAVLAAGSLALGHVRDRLHTARAALQEGQEFLHQHIGRLQVEVNQAALRGIVQGIRQTDAHPADRLDIRSAGQETASRPFHRDANRRVRLDLLERLEQVLA